jgi:chloramphenicol-sensitive protein RarD
MTEAQPSYLDERKGIFYAGGAYVMWGLVPLYWRALPEMSPLATTVYRVIWSAVFVAAVVAVQGHIPRLRAAIANRHTLGLLLISSVLITANWTIYLYCVATNQLVETALGYYITPLISFALGLIFFREKISKLRWFCIALAAGALAVQMTNLGHFPWIAPSLALSFGFYGYIRKLAPVAPLDGLLVETALMLPVALALAALWGIEGTAAFPTGDVGIDVLIALSGPLTAIPLAMFAAGARLVRMSTLGFLQYIAPSLTLLLATSGFGENFSQADLAAFALVWSALIIVALEGRSSYIRALVTRFNSKVGS